MQTLAYPIIQPAIKDLFVEEEGTCNINVINCSEYVPLGQKMKYGVIRASVLRAKGERSPRASASCSATEGSRSCPRTTST